MSASWMRCVRVTPMMPLCRVAEEAKRLWDCKYGRRDAYHEVGTSETGAAPTPADRIGIDGRTMHEIETAMQGRPPGTSLFESYAVTADARARLTLTLDEFKRYSSLGGPGVVAPPPDESVDAEITSYIAAAAKLVDGSGDVKRVGQELGQRGVSRGGVLAEAAAVAEGKDEGDVDIVGEWEARAIERSHEVCVDR